MTHNSGDGNAQSQYRCYDAREKARLMSFVDQGLGSKVGWADAM